MQHNITCELPNNCRISVIGLGGVGSIVLRYLALFLKSLGIAVRIRLIDGDEYEMKNASRQVFSKLDFKAKVQAADTAAMIGNSNITLVPIDKFITPDNIDSLIHDNDIIFMCVDDHGVRRIVSDFCESENISNVVLFNGGNEGIDPPKENGTFGNAQVYLKKEGVDVTVPITKYHPEIAKAEFNPSFGENGCGQIVDSVPQILFANLAVASAMLNAFFAVICNSLTYQEVQFDILQAKMMPHLSIDPPTGLLISKPNAKTVGTEP